MGTRLTTDKTSKWFTFHKNSFLFFLVHIFDLILIMLIKFRITLILVFLSIHCSRDFDVISTKYYKFIDLDSIKNFNFKIDKLSREVKQYYWNYLKLIML